MADQRIYGQSYEQWRQTIKWSDEEIAVALEFLADNHPHPDQKEIYRGCAKSVRQGRLSLKILLIALPVLVKDCAICGKKAIYRMGQEGRCSDHRMEKSVGVIRRQRSMESKNADVAAFLQKQETVIQTMQITRKRPWKKTTS